MALLPRDPSFYLKNAEWASSLPQHSLLVQVGANDHRPNFRISRGEHDIGALVVQQLGWSALLFEPFDLAYRLLRKRYEHEAPRVRTRNAAVCADDAHAALQPGECGPDVASMWVVDVTNATGNWGSEDADARCITRVNNTGFHYVLELSSFHAGHLIKHQNNLMARSPRNCAICSHVLYRNKTAQPPNAERNYFNTDPYWGRSSKPVTRWLPPWCLRHVIKSNLRQRPIRCACLDTEIAAMAAALPSRAPPSSDPAHARKDGAARAVVDLLVVDAEGHDDQVLDQYPFGRWAPRRLVFEPKHLPPDRFQALAARLRARGYECLEVLQARRRDADAAKNRSCYGRGGASTWHSMVL